MLNQVVRAPCRRQGVEIGQTWRHRESGRDVWVTGINAKGKWLCMWKSGQVSQLRDLTLCSGYVLVGRWRKKESLQP